LFAKQVNPVVLGGCIPAMVRGLGFQINLIRLVQVLLNQWEADKMASFIVAEGSSHFNYVALQV